MKKALWLAGFFVLVAFVAMNEVSNDLTEEDRVALSKFGRLTNQDHLSPVDKALVLLDQMQILIRKDYGIPKRQAREPADLIRFRTGKGYDWTRTAYKFFKSEGITCRMVSLYQTDGGLWALLYPGLSSYSGIEVLTKGKWVFIDPIGMWASILEDGSYAETRDLMNRDLSWKQTLPQALHDFRKEPFLPVYGLYSRHGQFYPPFSPVPDYNLAELKLNF